MNPAVKSLSQRWTAMKTRRANWEGEFSDLQRFIRPTSPDLNTGANSSKGQPLHNQIFDSTAPWALDQFANGLHSIATSAQDRWFEIRTQSQPNHELSRESVIWLETVSDILYHHMSLPESQFIPTLHEGYQDIGAFGTECIFIGWNAKEQHVFYRPIPLPDICIEENEIGIVDTVFRRRVLNKRQLLHEFPDIQFHPEVEKAQPDTEYEICHAVFPRKDRNYYGVSAKNKRFASVYFSEKLNAILEEGGYDTFPYSVARWTKRTGEVYGRGPGLSVLPAVRMINEMAKELIVSAQLANSPPIAIDQDSILLPVDDKTKFGIHPKSILWKEPGSETPEPVMSGSQPQLTLELMDAERQRIIQAFYVDHLIREQKKERQTVTEILDERGQMMRQMAPMLGRIQSELLGPAIKRTYFLLWKHRKLPEPPSELEGVPLDISYTTPAAKAQLGTKAQALQAYIESLAPMGQMDPNLLRKVDFDAVVDLLAEYRDVSRKVLKSEEQLRQEQEQQAQMQQAQLAAETVPNAAKAIRDVAEARQVDPSII